MASLFCTLFASAFIGATDLTPVQQLAMEEGQWTHAPHVPPPITRKDQRLVVVRWEAREVSAELAPGIVYDAYWTFEGSVPGPILRVREGDMVEIHLKNSIQNAHPHNIDFHFVTGPGGGAGPLTVKPGEEAVVRVRALKAGFYMYHCAAAEGIPMHVANGMYGFVLVDPAEELPKADHEWYVVQSEFYTQPNGKGQETFAYDKGLAENPSLIVFNGRVGALTGENALHAQIGEKIRLYVGNAGPNLISSFHVIGTIFENVYREGDLISPPGHNIQTTLIPAGGSAVVEFTAEVPGTYILVDHAIFRIAKGAVGQIMVGPPGTVKEIYDPVSTPQKNNAGGHDMNPEKPSTPPAKPEDPGSEKIPPASEPSPTPGLRAEKTAEIVVRIPLDAAVQSFAPNHDYNPNTVTISPGTTVTWVNDDGMAHTVTATGGAFDSGYLESGKRWSYTFKGAGVFEYICSPHPWMRGKVVVK